MIKKNTLVLTILLSFIFNSGICQYYDFPFTDWNQTSTGYTWTGVINEVGISKIEFTRDTIIGQQSYFTNGGIFYRSENGKVYQNIFDWQTQTYAEQLEFDFTLNVGDSFTNYFYDVGDSLKVISKMKIENLEGDSVWQLEIEKYLNWITNDTLTWIEGVGDKDGGLTRYISPDGSSFHSCTAVANGVKIYVNEDNTEYCNCTFSMGVDEDNDGFGNYIPRTAVIDLGFHFNNPDAKKNYKVKDCDTLKLISPDLSLIYLNIENSCTGNFLDIDSLETTANGDFVFYIYDIIGETQIFLSDQCSWDFGNIWIQSCFENDCDDTNPNINELAIEIPNNGIDENCDGVDLMTATADFLNYKVDVFPNPVSSTLQIQYEGDSKFEIQLFDLFGNLLFNDKNIEEISVQHLPQGIYILKIQDLNSNQFFTERIVVAK